MLEKPRLSTVPFIYFSKILTNLEACTCYINKIMDIMLVLQYKQKSKSLRVKYGTLKPWLE